MMSFTEQEDNLWRNEISGFSKTITDSVWIDLKSTNT